MPQQTSESRVAVTGASGFLGSYFCRAFTDRGYRVCAITSRPGAVTSASEIRDIRDLCDDRAVFEALAGARLVVHLAGRAHQRENRRGDEDVYHAANAVAAEVVCRAAGVAGATHVAVMSSAAVVGDGSHTLV